MGNDAICPEDGLDPEYALAMLVVLIAAGQCRGRVCGKDQKCHAHSQSKSFPPGDTFAAGKSIQAQQQESQRPESSPATGRAEIMEGCHLVTQEGCDKQQGT